MWWWMHNSIILGFHFTQGEGFSQLNCIWGNRIILRERVFREDIKECYAISAQTTSVVDLDFNPLAKATRNCWEWQQHRTVRNSSPMPHQHGPIDIGMAITAPKVSRNRAIISWHAETSQINHVFICDTIGILSGYFAPHSLLRTKQQGTTQLSCATQHPSQWKGKQKSQKTTTKLVRKTHILSFFNR